MHVLKIKCVFKYFGGLGESVQADLSFLGPDSDVLQCVIPFPLKGTPQGVRYHSI